MLKQSLPLALLAFTCAANAQTANGAVGVGIGTTGLSLQASKGLRPDLNARVGLNYLRYNHNSDVRGQEYDMRLRGESLDALLDYYPNRTPFHLTGGLTYNHTHIDADARATNGAYMLNGQAFPAGAVGALNGEVRFRPWAPYLGIGWGNPVGDTRTWAVSGDLGVSFQGTPRVGLTGTCGPSAASVAGGCTGLQTSVGAEQRALADKVDRYKYFPVVRVSLSRPF
jgi:hypothetical protein